MRPTQSVRLDHGNGLATEIDLGKIDMTDEQREIVGKLFSKISGKDLSYSGECTDGDCPAAEVLPSDEFEKIRGLSATIGSSAVPQAMVICDFCLNCYAQPH